MVKLLIMLFVVTLGPRITPNTEYLMISKSCGPCIKAIKIVSKLQSEGYDVGIINIKGNPAERVLAKFYKIKTTPTLVIREWNKKAKKIVGLQSEERYRELISQ